MLLYPLAITLILLALCGRLFGNDRRVYAWTTGFTLIAALFDFIKSLPAGLIPAAALEHILNAAKTILPFFEIGLGWVCPAAIGLIIGLILRFVNRGKETSTVTA